MKGNFKIRWRWITFLMIIVAMIFPGSRFVQASNESNNLQLDYKLYYQNYGWSKCSNKLDEQINCDNNKIESIKIENNLENEFDILCSVYIDDDGWTTFVESGKAVGKISRNKSIKDIRMKLSKGLDKEYNIEYRVCYGDNMWSKWFCNGQKSNKDYTRDLYNLEIRVVKK